MSNLKSLSAHILDLALYCRDSWQVPLSICCFMALFAHSAWSILSSVAGSMRRHFLLSSKTGLACVVLVGSFSSTGKICFRLL